MATDSPGHRPAVLFDLDGTVLDSAPGIVSAFQQAMRDVGLEPADAAALRSDLGPPPPIILAQVGVPEELIPAAVAAYRRHYLDRGIRDASVFPGVAAALVDLASRYRLATATMKLISTAVPFLAQHGIAEHFAVVGGAQEPRPGEPATPMDKAAIIATTRTALGDPPADRMIMVGDRHSDISGARRHGLRTVAVTWGYGSRAELETEHPDRIIDVAADLPAVVDELIGAASPA